jgi:phosphoglycerate dehydrogenase-like enzyme
MHIHFIYPPDPDQITYLEGKLDEKILFSNGEIFPEHSQTRILVAGRPTREQLELLPNLEILIIPWTGIPEETRSILAQYPDLKVHNLHHNAASTAELAIGLLLSAAKQIIPFDRSLRQGNWQPRYHNRETILLAGKQALILGYGEIGKRIKKGLEGLEVKVKVIKRTLGKSDHNQFIYPPGKLQGLLPETDILILALPLTEKTENLIGETELRLLPSSAILINVSRGKIISQDALFKALKDNQIFGAGLDVWYNYPDSKEARDDTPPGDFPFHELNNLVFSPHRGGLVVETEDLRMADLVRLINAAARGEEIPNRVDLEQGY